MQVRNGMGRFVVPLLLLFLFVSTGCDTRTEQDKPADDGDQDADSEPDTESAESHNVEDGLGSDDTDPLGHSLAGLWAIKFSMSYTCFLPVFERRVQMILTGVGLVRAEQDGPSVTFSEQSCDFRLDVVEVDRVPFIVVFPQLEIEALPVETRKGEVETQGTETALHVNESLDIYGADIRKFDDPERDPLPEDTDDPRLVNLGDDKPGVTVRLMGPFSGMEVYVVMRMKRELLGTPDGIDLIRGDVVSDVEIRTIGASNPLVKLQLDFEPHPVAELNRFEMVRLDADTRCEWIYENQDSLFSYDALDHATPFTYDR